MCYFFITHSRVETFGSHSVTPAEKDRVLQIPEGTLHVWIVLPVVYNECYIWFCCEPTKFRSWSVSKGGWKSGWSKSFLFNFEVTSQPATTLVLSRWWIMKCSCHWLADSTYVDLCVLYIFTDGCTLSAYQTQLQKEEFWAMIELS